MHVNSLFLEATPQKIIDDTKAPVNYCKPVKINYDLAKLRETFKWTTSAYDYELQVKHVIFYVYKT